jgi:hypothetical protein
VNQGDGPDQQTVEEPDEGRFALTAGDHRDDDAHHKPEDQECHAN